MRSALRTFFSIIAWTILVTVLWVLVLRWADPPVTWRMAGEAAVEKGVAREWKDLEEIARAMPLAIIAAEDQKFMEHNGFDMEAIEKAWEAYNKDTKGGRKRVKGGSTISQQTAKNVFLWPGRNFLRKGAEAYFTFLIEALWGKERILEVYLNVAETGAGRFGVEAAARYCFDRSAARLSQEQAALIAVVLPSPKRYDCRAPGTFVRRRQQWTLRQMRNIGDVISAPPVVVKGRRKSNRK